MANRVFKYAVLVFFVMVIVGVALKLLLQKNSVTENPDMERDLEFILSGISDIRLTATTKHSSALSIYGPDAFPVVAGAFNSIFHPVIAAGYYGKGRYAVYTNSECFLTLNNTNRDNDQLFANIATWISREKINARVGLFVHEYNSDKSKFEGVLKERGMITKFLHHEHRQLENITFLKEFDLLVIIVNRHNTDIDDKNIHTLAKYISHGGGMILGTYAIPDHSLLNPYDSCFQETFWGNKILKQMKSVVFVWPYPVLQHTTPEGLNASKEYLKNTNAVQVWADMRKSPYYRNYSSQEQRQRNHVLIYRVTGAPKDTTFFNEILNEVNKLIAAVAKGTSHGDTSNGGNSDSESKDGGVEYITPDRWKTITSIYKEALEKELISNHSCPSSNLIVNTPFTLLIIRDRIRVRNTTEPFRKDETDDEDLSDEIEGSG